MQRTILSNLDAKAAFHLDKFKLFQPLIKVSGIWKQGWQYYLVCPEVNDSTLTGDGRPLQQWVKNEFREMAFSIQVVAQAPSDAVPVLSRTKSEMISSDGIYRNRSFLNSDLAIELPDSFPNFYFLEQPQNIIYVERELTDEEFFILSKIFRRFAYPFNVDVRADPSEFERLTALREANIKKQEMTTRILDQASLAKINFSIEPLVPLTVSRYLGSDFSQDLKSALREDEKFWIENRETVIGSESQIPSISLVREKYDGMGLLDLRFNKPISLNNYYCIFNHLTLILPPGDLQTKLDELNVTTSQIVELLAAKRLSIVLPSDVKKYPREAIETFVEANRHGVIFPRRLTTLIVNDAKRRFPILYPPLNIDQMNFLLNAIVRASKAISDPKIASYLQTLATELPTFWLSPSTEFPYKGTDSIAFSGLGRLLAIVWGMTEPIKTLSLINSLLSVQIAAALGAVQLPDASSERLISVGTSIYSGVQTGSIPEMQSKLEVIVNNLFTVAADLPVTDFINAFSSADVRRLKRYISDMASSSSSLDEAADIAKAYNEDAKRFAASSDRINNLDVLGFIAALASAKGLTPAFVPPTIWITALLHWLLEKEKSGIASSIMDVFDSLGKAQDPRTVLIARIKKNLGANI